MGSLDAWLVAVGFRLFGESVLTIRIVQTILYLLIVATEVLFAWRITRKPIIAAVTGLVLALPPVLFALYTTATLGGYNEMLLCGNLALLFGWDVAHEQRRSWWRWAALGVVTGIGWWSNGLIIAFALPIGALILYRMARDRAWAVLLRGLLIAAACFVIGSAPWWNFNLENDFAPLRFYLVGGERGEFAGTDIPPLPFGERVLGMVFLGLPAVVGLRFPWSPAYVFPVVGVIVALIYAAAFAGLLRRVRDEADAFRPFVALMIALFCALFVLSRFSIDPTGRYFLPLLLPLGIALGALIDALWRVRRAAAVVIAALVLGYNAAGQMSAAGSPPGFTTQFNLDTHIPNTWDADLIAFLDEQQLYHGYTNYWIAFRLAFLSGDRMQYSAALSYKPDLSYTPADDRYPPYRRAADAADHIAYITANVTEVKAWLEARFADRGVTYQSAQVGVYHIYYGFEPETPRPPLD
jgi:4-amino-4-deoxy-L-arabinose transferase-like glycosyltransferase